MGKLSLTLIVVGTAACGSNNNNPVDAHVVVPDAKIDAQIDAKLFNDAPAPNLDFSCFGLPAPTMADDPVTISGTTSEISQAGLTATDGVTVAFFKSGVATALATVTTAGGGLFASGNVATGGTPVDAYIRASLAQTRTTYLYPPNVVHKSIANVPVPLVTNATFGLLTMFAQVTQDDTNDGALIAILSDCAQTPINGATLSVKQGTTEVGTQFDLGQLSSMAAGTFFVFNVPDGSTTLTATYGTMTFPVRTVLAHKTADGAGSMTATEVLPGPI
jgi:hypothetical protein